MNILMILGHAHSASTLVGILLGSSPDITFIGEEYDFFREDALDDYCTCGERVGNCPFWSRVNERLIELEGPDFRKEIKGGYRGLHRDAIYFLGKEHPCQERCKQIISSFYKSLHEQAGTKYLLSSAKNVAYARKILEDLFGPETLKYLITVRNPMGAVASFLRHGWSFWQSVRIIGTTYVMLKLAVPRTRRFVVKYEDWINNPVEFFHKLTQKLDAALPEWDVHRSENTIAIKPLKQIHIFAGNKIRKKEKHLIKEDLRWKTELSLGQKIIIATTLLPLYKLLY